LGWEGVAEAAAALRLSAGDTLVDLACGRGGDRPEGAGPPRAGPGGAPFSAPGGRRGPPPPPRLGGPAGGPPPHPARAPGRERGWATVAPCGDGMPFGPQPGAAYRESRRILATGGRAVLTNWEPRHPGDERRPDRVRHVALRAGLAAAGFGEIEVRERPGWR